MKKWILTSAFAIIFSLNIAAQDYKDLVVKGMEFAEKGDDKAAAPLLEAALKKEPGNPSNIMLMVNLATIKRNLKEYEGSLLLYNTALELHPKNIFIRHNRAALFCEIGKYEEAMKDYSTILLYEPENLEAIYRQSLLELNSKNLLAAEEGFEKVLEIAPEHLKAKQGLGMVLKSRMEWDKAEELYTDLIYKYRNIASLYYDRAECYLNMKKLARTQEDLSSATKFGYNKASVKLLQGRLFLAQFDKIQAKESLLEAKELGADEEIVNTLLQSCK